MADIKTPVRISRQIEGGTCEICDADGFYFCSTVCRETAEQIVSFFNAQRPKCKTCGDKKVVQIECEACAKDIPHPASECGGEKPCPDCQQPIAQAKPKGELDEG